jgi:hypothetical protein
MVNNAKEGPVKRKGKERRRDGTAASKQVQQGEEAREGRERGEM